MTDKLQMEQDAFDAALENLLRDHAGEVVIFKDERPVGFFASFDDAYREALARYGLDEVFFLSEVSRRSQDSSSLSWDLGVL